MSWLDKVTTKIVITTGDGENFYPQWINAQRSKEYNVSEFEYVEIPGTHVDRRKAKGRRYNLEIHFQGNNHLDIADKFDKSADVEKYWTISHPFYGFINVQPLSLGQDNSVYNISKFTIPIVETIIDDEPHLQGDPIGSIKVNKAILDEEFAGSITATIQSSDINNLSAVNKKSFDLTVPIIKLPEEYQNALNVFNQANAAIDTATASPILAMRSAISVLSLPATLNVNLQTRLNTLVDQFELLNRSVAAITGVAAKQIYQVQGGSLLSAMCLAVVNPLSGDFSNSKKITQVITTISNSFGTYVSNLDFLQSPNGSTPLSYIPGFNSLVALNELLNETISYLYNAAIGAKIERSIICEYDTNIIILTHRLYGLDSEDIHLVELIANNDLSVDEYTIIKKGRKIIYYL